MKSYVNGLLIVMQFFSVIPIQKEIPITQKNLERAIRTFPLFGLSVGTFIAGIAYVMVVWTPFSPLIITLVLWIFLIFLTGGIHLDAWIDTSDAFFSYREKEKRLEIMSDPRTGAFGVISIIVLLITKFVVMYEVVLHIHLFVYVFIILILFYTRMLMGLSLAGIPVAKNTGFAALFQLSKKPQTFYFCLGYMVPILILLSVWDISTATFALGLFLITIGVYLYGKSKVREAFGGVTGDVIGAMAEGAELILWIAVLLFTYYGME